MYFIDINSGDEKLAKAYGDLETVSYVARKAALNAEKEYAVRLLHVPAIDDHTNYRSLATLTASGEIVSLVLAKRVTAEKKALGLPTAGAKKKVKADENGAAPVAVENVKATPAKAVAAK